MTIFSQLLSRSLSRRFARDEHSSQSSPGSNAHSLRTPAGNCRARQQWHILHANVRCHPGAGKSSYNKGYDTKMQCTNHSQACMARLSPFLLSLPSSRIETCELTEGGDGDASSLHDDSKRGPSPSEWQAFSSQLLGSTPISLKVEGLAPRSLQHAPLARTVPG